MNCLASVLAASLLLLMPSMVRAQEVETEMPQEQGTVYLILRYGGLSANSLEKLPMLDMDQCEMQGAIWESSKRMSRSGSSAVLNEGAPIFHSCNARASNGSRAISTSRQGNSVSTGITTNLLLISRLCNT